MSEERDEENSSPVTRTFRRRRGHFGHWREMRPTNTNASSNEAIQNQGNLNSVPVELQTRSRELGLCFSLPFLPRSFLSSDPVLGESYCDCYKEKDHNVECTCGEDDTDFDWVWDHNQRSVNTNLQNGNREVRFHSEYSCGTAAVRGNQAMASNQHYWEIKMTSPVYGTDMMVGVGTETIDLDRHHYTFCSLLGSDCDSWGLSYTGLFHHQGEAQCYAPRFGQGSIIGVHLDMWNGTLSFYKNRQPLGVACSGLKGKTLFPMVSSTAARSGMKVIRTRSFNTSLQYLCCVALRKIVPSELGVLDVLALPPGLSGFLENNLDWLLGAATTSQLCCSANVNSNNKTSSCDSHDENGEKLLNKIQPRLYHGCCHTKGSTVTNSQETSCWTSKCYTSSAGMRSYNAKISSSCNCSKKAVKNKLKPGFFIPNKINISSIADKTFPEKLEINKCPSDSEHSQLSTFVESKSSKQNQVKNCSEQEEYYTDDELPEIKTSPFTQVSLKRRNAVFCNQESNKLKVHCCINPLHYVADPGPSSSGLSYKENSCISDPGPAILPSVQNPDISPLILKAVACSCNSTFSLPFKNSISDCETSFHSKKRKFEVQEEKTDDNSEISDFESSPTTKKAKLMD
ncbi:uncharacterized protein LOC143234788 isoform X1 [Tachypleus tridentatus]|uniref:uncharacterized protein LOC143234788 isoform X1 n=2 Tax=Tachypleus tridentatus TaxID=6853 RepID=UPI003FD654F1